MSMQQSDFRRGKATYKKGFEAGVASVAPQAQTDATLSSHVRMSQALQDVVAERERQQTDERYSTDHDDGNKNGEMATAAACYALSSTGYDRHALWELWPRTWGVFWFKPTTPRRDLVKSAALIIAEIERLDRAVVSVSEVSTDGR